MRDVEVATTVPEEAVLGVYAGWCKDRPCPTSDFEHASGAPIAIVHWYQAWGAFVTDDRLEMVDHAMLATTAARGMIPMITWEPWGNFKAPRMWELRRIATGEFDGYLDRWAADLRDHGGPVFIRPFHEMNNWWYPWAIGNNGNTTHDLVAAWRHIHARFERAGATNVIWVWSPAAINDLASYEAMYPGDAYVDWLAVDIYNAGTEIDWGGWRDVDEAAGPSLRELHRLNPDKPLMIAETSSAEGGGDKAAWVRDMLELPSVYPRVRAIVWFHDDIRYRGETNWRVDSSARSLAAYREAARHPRYAGGAPDLVSALRDRAVAVARR